GFAFAIRSLLSEREDNARCKVRAAGPPAKCWILEIHMEFHTAYFELQRHRILERNIHTAANASAERALGPVTKRRVNREVSDADARESIRSNLRRAIRRLASEGIGDQCGAIAKAINTHVILKAPRLRQIETGLIGKPGMMR